MVFKGRFFSSKKSSDSAASSPDGSNSPKTPTLDSPNRSEKKKVKSSTDASSSSSSSPASSFRHTLRQQLHQSSAKIKSGVISSEAAAKAKDKEKDRAKDKDKSKDKDFARGKESSPASASAKLWKGAAAAEGSLSPILASSLGLNRIKTRSGPLPQESGHRMSTLGSSTLGRGRSDGGNCSTSSSSGASLLTAAAGKSSGKKKDGLGLEKVPETYASSWADRGGRSGSRGKDWSGDLRLRSQISNGDSSTSRQFGISWNQSEGGKNSASCTLDAETAYDPCETPKESESPRFKAIMQATSAPRKKFPADIKSFSHELNSKGVRPFPFWKPRGIFNSKEVLKVIQAKFEKAKEEVNSDLAVFAGDLVGIMEKHAESHHEWKEILEDLLLLARSCVVMTPGEFWLQCEGIVQHLFF